MLNDDALDLIFRKARTHNAWRDCSVTDDDIRRIYELVKWGPTSANMCPARFVFVRSREAKERLAPALSSGNLEKTMAAPATAVIGYDVKFFERMDYLFPHNAAMADFYRNGPEAAEDAGFRNGTLQGAYFMIAARALGFDIGAMSGFDKDKVTAAFFAGTSVKANFLCNIGHGDESVLLERHPRLDFDEACCFV